MDKVHQLNVDKDMKISQLIDQFDASGVLGSGRVARSCNILADMIRDEGMSVFMSLGGPLIPGGLRNIVTQMISKNHVDLIISSGANITHDLLEAFGGSHYRDEGRDDEELNAEGIGRIADINVGSDDFTVFESEITSDRCEMIRQLIDHLKMGERLFTLQIYVRVLELFRW